ncbi:MAG: SMC-Scp complex subunit ScpB [Elusimicrobiales bacterium]|nr:SMC-Scp complex subunit ScpB [Elusimicrobiales bacterium]
MEREDLLKVIETLLFITDEPLTSSKISKICELNDDKLVESIIEELRYRYDSQNSAISIVKVAGGWQMATRPQYSLWVRKLYSTRLNLRLSNAALEVLGIIAYRQPITRAEIEAIRGVDSSGPIETLLERKLITSIGRKEVIGRPIMYGTTDEFLKQFGLNSIEDLPKIDTLVDSRVLSNIKQNLNEISNNISLENIENSSQDIKEN